jgi:aminoglycoside/choline kinase family phosphotransferase
VLVDAGWFAVGAFRLLQALGAFAKLGGRFGKPGFLEHATTGLEHLLAHLGERGRRRYPTVAALVAAAQDAWAVSPRRP